jgi:hypothetical protein
MFLLSLLLTLLGGASLVAAPAPDAFGDNLERGLCVGGCRGWNWAASQQINGSLSVVAGRGGKVLRARTDARGSRVPKAALIARPIKLRPGTTVRISFLVMVPQGAPLDSIHLVDLECASCGEAGNPGIRLYLRHGRLRVDRAKIGERSAWTNDTASQLRHKHWHRIALEVAVGFGNAGGVRAYLDGKTVLEPRGDTIIRPQAGAAAGADRIQIGLTASSNTVPAVAYFDDVTVRIVR